MTDDEEGLLRGMLEHNAAAGGSGRGISFFKDAAACGMRALLAQREREERALLVSNESTPPTPEEMQRRVADRDKFRVGSAYHTFQELWRRGTLQDVTLSFNAPLHDASFEEGARLFRAYAQHWPKDLWGQVTDIELVLPSSEDAQNLVMSKLFGDDITGKPDMVVNVREEDLERIQTRCVSVREPGVYLIDFKTEDVPGNDLQYKAGEQAMLYPHLWDIENPSRPCVGTIFDIVYKHSRRKPLRCEGYGDFHAVFVPKCDREQLGAMYGTIVQAQANLERAHNYDMGNRMECFKFAHGKMQPCRFFGKACQNEALLLTETVGLR